MKTKIYPLIILSFILNLFYSSNSIAQTDSHEIRDWLYFCDKEIIECYNKLSNEFKQQVSENSWEIILKERNKHGGVVSRELLATEQVYREDRNEYKNSTIFEYQVVFKDKVVMVERISVEYMGTDFEVTGYYFK